MIMTEKYKILGQYIKDLSSETPDVETYLYVRDYISKYQLGIDITSKALKNKMIEVNTTFNFNITAIMCGCPSQAFPLELDVLT